MRGSNSNSIGVEHGTFGSTPWRQDSPPRYVVAPSLDDDETNSAWPSFDGSYREVVLGDENSGRPDAYHYFVQDTTGSQPSFSNTTLTPDIPMYALSELAAVSPLGAVPAQAPWSALNTRDGAADTGIADNLALRYFPGTGTGSKAFSTVDVNSMTDSVRSFARDVDGTTGTNNMDGSMITIRPEVAVDSFGWTEPPEYPYSQAQQDRQDLTYPEVNVPEYISDEEGNGYDDTGSQNRRDQ
jgi:hypothetical protein